MLVDHRLTHLLIEPASNARGQQRSAMPRHGIGVSSDNRATPAGRYGRGPDKSKRPVMIFKRRVVLRHHHCLSMEWEAGRAALKAVTAQKSAANLRRDAVSVCLVRRNAQK
jgi:hypothetical protein